MILHCNVSNDFSIEDGDGNKLTIAEARQLSLAGKVTDCNIGFQRLASYDFDVERLKQFYIDNP